MIPRSIRHAGVLAALVLGATACMRLDVFVFRALPAEDMNADLMADSIVPADLREELKLPSTDGVTVNAYLLKHRPDDGTDERRHNVGLVYCYGQANHSGTSVARTDVLWQMGYTVLVADYRGFGKTVGKPSELGIYADLAAARAHLESRSDLGLSADRVGLYGRSLGSAICLSSAAEHPTKVVVLESPISSIDQMVADSVYLEAPGGWFLDNRMDNVERIRKHKGALLVIHGTEDDYVSPAYGELLHETAQGHASPNDLWLIEGANHSTVPCVEHRSGADVPRNGCAGGFSPEWKRRVGEFYDAAFGIDP